jgi:hypothetical protein
VARDTGSGLCVSLIARLAERWPHGLGPHRVSGMAPRTVIDCPHVHDDPGAVRRRRTQLNSRFHFRFTFR